MFDRWLSTETVRSLCNQARSSGQQIVNDSEGTVDGDEVFVSELTRLINIHLEEIVDHWREEDL